MSKYILKNNLTGFKYPQDFYDIDEAVKIKNIENQVKAKQFFPGGFGVFIIETIREEKDLVI